MQRSNQEDNGGAFYLAQDGHTLLVEDNDSDSDGSSFQQQRCSSLQNPYGCHDLSLSFHDTVLDLYAASKIFYLHLVTFESLLVMLCSIVATTCYYLYGRSSNTGGSSFGANISWMIVSFAIVSPMIMQIKQAFARRELALDVLAETKALIVNVMLANAMWNWGDNGRSKLPSDHAQKTKTLLKSLVNTASHMLQLPIFSRGRHRFTDQGRKFAGRYFDAVSHSQLMIIDTLRQLHGQVEVMKSVGLPANEASRINQYHWMLQARLEKLQNIKFYRTPQATRSFTRLFILVLPIFYGPYYVYLIDSDDTHHMNFGFCLLLSVVTSLIMIGIFNVEKAMEDPFAAGGMDGIPVQTVFDLVHQMLDVAYDGGIGMHTSAMTTERVPARGLQPQVVHSA